MAGSFTSEQLPSVGQFITQSKSAQRLEFSEYGTGDFRWHARPTRTADRGAAGAHMLWGGAHRPASFRATYYDGSTFSSLVYKSHVIVPGKVVPVLKS